ncbi:MAG TPA: hypothetical protein VI233_12010 [Puia sp.]
MIVVLSYDTFEQGTEGVLEWLAYLGADFLKITMKDIFRQEADVYIDVDLQRLYVNGVDITDDIRVFFYRRLHSPFLLEDPIANPFRRQIEELTTNESNTIVRYLAHIFRNKVWLPEFGSAHVNKLVVTQMARELGLEVPRTRIINNKKNLREFYCSTSAGLITKPAAGVSYFVLSATTYFPYTTLLDQAAIDVLPDHFFPSLFQERIEKEYEIRCFFLEDEYYSLALLISSGEHSIDIKEQSEPGQKRWVNYRLPDTVIEKIARLMKKLRLNTGSIDIIRKPTGEYVFIEVNTVGQYGHGSYYGNFDLERRIAQWLISKDQAYVRETETALYGGNA